MITYENLIQYYSEAGYTIIDVPIRQVTVGISPSSNKTTCTVLVFCCNEQLSKSLTGINGIINKLKALPGLPKGKNVHYLTVIISYTRNKYLKGKNIIQIEMKSLKMYKTKMSPETKKEVYILSSLMNDHRLLEERSCLRWHNPDSQHKVVITYLLIFTNIMIYLLADTESLYRYGLVASNVMHNEDIKGLITYMFLHAGILHLIGNMIALFFAGRIFEKDNGALKMLIVYILSGIYGGLFSVVFMPELFPVTVGASGAICGILGALLADAIFRKDLSRNTRIKSVTTTIAVLLLSGLFSKNTNHICHIGGIFAGFMFMWLITLTENISAAKRHIRLEQYFEEKRSKKSIWFNTRMY